MGSRVDLRLLAEAEHEAAAQAAAGAVLNMLPLGQRWEEQPTKRHRAELIAALEVVIPLLDRTLAAYDRWLVHSAARLSGEELERARHGRDVTDGQIGQCVEYLARVTNSPTGG